MKYRIFFILSFLLLISCSGISTKQYTFNNAAVPLFTFVFDDGYETDYLIAKDIFKARHAVACSAVVTDWLNTKDYLTGSQLLDLQDNGWEILSHTKSHSNLRALSENRIEAELSESKSALEGMGIKVRNLVYPFNKYNDTVIKIARKYYRSGRGGRIILKATVPDQYYLQSFRNEHTFPYAKELIDKAVTNKQWLILYHHMISARVKVEKMTGKYVSEEILHFQPSGATGKYMKGSGSKILFLPLSGNPRVHDTVTGQSGGAVSTVYKVDYNDRETIAELIEYIQKTYPEMPIVTINEGLDRIMPLYMMTTGNKSHSEIGTGE
jgi:peptidoglycan/xylan/chitin deacetylase (PgdA/CDA1 family)